MIFKKWLEVLKPNPYNTTMDFFNINSTEDIGDATTSQQAKNGQESNQNPTLKKIEIALTPLSVNNTESGFSGTVDYAAPEQFSSTGINQSDFYQSFLNDLFNLFPNQKILILKISNNWNSFKNEFKQMIDKKQYMDKQMYPIHYAIPSKTLKDATKAFLQIKILLDQDNDPSLEKIKKTFNELFFQHESLKKIIEIPLETWLNQSRQNPDSFFRKS